MKNRKLKTKNRKAIGGGALFGFLFLLGRLAGATDVQISASLDHAQMAMNEQAVLSVTVTGNSSNMPDPTLPDLPNFQVYNAGRAQSFSWVNGQTSASVTHSYVLTPKQEGKFTIPPVQLIYQGQTYSTQPLDLAVVRGNPAAVPSPGAPAAPAPSSEPRPARGERAAGLFISAEVDKSSVFVGEPVTFIFRLYNRMTLLRAPQYQPPNTTGFWNEDLPPQRNYNTTVKGIPYQVTEIRTALFPSTSGKMQIGAASLDVQLGNMSADPFNQDFFAAFFGRGEEKVLHTDPISIHVKPLPSPKPVTFKGAVGQYHISADLDKTSVTVGQPLTLTLTVAGRGNIKSLPDVPLPAIDNFRTFDANAATNIDKKDYQVEGSKVFKSVLIPTTSGDLAIPPVAFSYFDPEGREYKYISTRPLTVHVTAGAPGASAPVPGYSPAASAPGIRLLGEDIRYIKTPTSISAQGRPLYRRPGFWVLNLLAFLFLVGSGGVPLYRRLFLSNTALNRFRAARGHAFELIKASEEAAAQSEIKRAAGLMADALETYLSAKLNQDGHSLSLKDVLDQLRALGLHLHTGEKVRNLWETLDLFQFAPAQVRPDELRQTRNTLEHIIEELERQIEWKD